ncbi:MAG: SOS response-associated peptidase [Bacteroidetes bacterium]|nr:SOS response-associated peptidase [Bacteroidota bacterium]
MCGRFSFVMEDALIRERFGIRVQTDIYKARYNCAPTQNLAVIAGEDSERLQFFRWGLIPYWAKDAAIGNKLINARGETVAEKPSFRNAFKNRRCLVPATGFFEWRADRVKTPFNIRMKNGEPFAFAGLWDKWVSNDGEAINSFTIITTIPNELTSPIHDRMPVILHREDEGRWISSKFDFGLSSLLKPYPAELMEAYQVSTLVNISKNDIPAVLERSGLF